MFLQETKTKRGGKTYISYLVRESYRTANGPRGRTICNLTHLPKEVRDMVARALRGEPLVPLDNLEINNIHSVGGCVVLEDAAQRFDLRALLAPLSPRSASLVQAMIFGGLLFPPSVAPFYIESKTARLAAFCGLDPDKEHFELADLNAALRELDERWLQVSTLLMRPPHGDVRAITFFRTSQAAEHLEVGALGMDADGIPVPLSAENGDSAGAGLQGFLRQVARQSKSGPPLLTLDEETAARIHVERLEKQPYLIEVAPESLGAMLRQLNHAQLVHALRTGGPVEVRHHGERYILAPSVEHRDVASEANVRIGSIKELTTINSPKSVETVVAARTASAGTVSISNFQSVATNVPAERLPAVTAIEWAHRARSARAAFSPVQIVMGRPSSTDAVLTWRNHQNLQFLTHRLRCHLHSEWRARGESRPVEEVLRDLQEVHRATLTVDGVVVRRLATHPSKAVAAVLTKLDLWDLFETPDGPKKVSPRGDR